MQRAHEIANSIVDDSWTKYSKSIGLDEFDDAVNNYIQARQEDENFSDDYAYNLKSNAYHRLREETINGIYNDMRKIKDKDRKIKQPKQSIKAASTETLENTISDQFNREQYPYDAYVRMEYKSRSYQIRYYDAKDEAKHAEREIKRYDRYNDAGLAVEDAKVIRDYYEKHIIMK